MFNLFYSKEKKRIEELFNLFDVQLQQGISKDEALMRVWGELTTRNVPLKDKFGFKERNIDSKKVLLKEMFASFDVVDYDIFRSVQFIVSWEFPQKYNQVSSVEDVRSGKGLQSTLELKVKEIGKKIL